MSLLLCQALPPFHRHLGTSFHLQPFPAEVTGGNQTHGIALARNGALGCPNPRRYFSRPSGLDCGGAGLLHPESGSKSKKRQQCAGGESLCAVPGCAPRAPSRRGLLIPSRLRPRTRPSAEGPAQLKSPRPLTPRGHRGNLRARSPTSREATVLRSQSPSAPPRAPGKAQPGWRGTRAHAQTGGARQAPAPAPAPLRGGLSQP